jgi:hypothetical protein
MFPYLDLRTARQIRSGSLKLSASRPPAEVSRAPGSLIAAACCHEVFGEGATGAPTDLYQSWNRVTAVVRRL